MHCVSVDIASQKKPSNFLYNTGLIYKTELWNARQQINFDNVEVIEIKAALLLPKLYPQATTAPYLVLRIDAARPFQSDQQLVTSLVKV